MPTTDKLWTFHNAETDLRFASYAGSFRYAYFLARVFSFQNGVKVRMKLVKLPYQTKVGF